MASRVITYIWGIGKPKDPQLAQGLKAAAYKTAMATDPTTTKILIRSVPKPQRHIHGKLWHDETRCTPYHDLAENLDMERAGTPLPSHGYTDGENSTNVARVEPDDVKPDFRRRKAWWPEHNPEEEVEGPPIDPSDGSETGNTEEK